MAARLPQRGRAGRIRDVVDQLVAAGVRPAARVSVWVEATDGTGEREDARLDHLVAIVAAQPRDMTLAVVIDAFGDGSAARLRAVAANGLAG
jgi:hypothetical protein